jgi:hypothetical protein
MEAGQVLKAASSGARSQFARRDRRGGIIQQLSEVGTLSNITLFVTSLQPLQRPPPTIKNNAGGNRFKQRPLYRECDHVRMFGTMAARMGEE